MGRRLLRVGKWTLFLVGAALALSPIAVMVPARRAEARLRRVLNELAAAGAPVKGADLVRPPVLDEENAALVYRQAFEAARRPCINVPADQEPEPLMFSIYWLAASRVAVGYVVAFAYGTLMLGRFGRTVGMKWLGIRVTNLDGSDIGWRRAALRHQLGAHRPGGGCHAGTHDVEETLSLERQTQASWRGCSARAISGIGEWHRQDLSLLSKRYRPREHDRDLPRLWECPPPALLVSERRMRDLGMRPGAGCVIGRL